MGMSGKSNSAAKAGPAKSKTKNGRGATGSAANVKFVTRELSAAEKKTLAECEAIIQTCQTDRAEDFQKLAVACFQIQAEKLFEGHRSVAAYFKAKFGFSRTNTIRLAKMGSVIKREAPTGASVGLLGSDGHLRPLIYLADAQQRAVIKKAQDWAEMAKLVDFPAKLIVAAKTFLYPPARAEEPRDSAQAKLVAKFQAAVDGAKSALPENAGPGVMAVFEDLRKKVKAMGAVRRSTGIAWTDATWNPLHGCTHASRGCDRCYAAKLTATRLADVYPGLAVEKKSADGKTTTYSFTGIMQLLPHDLADPLLDQIPKMYFVNSMSDLFHKSVPEQFIADCFTVMEKAHWHRFQVLTKRPERMAEFTQKRYANIKPFPNIWLGTSTEDQEAFDKRMPHLKKTKAAVRWLSAEPLLGPIKFGSMADLDWIVVGGESGSDRQMQKSWATAIRDECKKSKVPYFFKQWGNFNELGKREREKVHPATLDGVVHDAYPEGWEK